MITNSDRIGPELVTTSLKVIPISKRAGEKTFGSVRSVLKVFVTFNL